MCVRLCMRVCVPCLEPERLFNRLNRKLLEIKLKKMQQNINEIEINNKK